jgi:hypothetical protein
MEINEREEFDYEEFEKGIVYDSIPERYRDIKTGRFVSEEKVIMNSDRLR